MISLFVAVIWNPSLCQWRRASPTGKAFVPTSVWFVLNEPLIPSRGPDDVDPRFVGTGDPRDDRLLELRRDVRRAGRQLPDGMSDRPGHVDAGLLDGRTGPPGPAAEPRRSLALRDPRLALGTPLRLPLAI